MDFFDAKKVADAVIICTMDRQHEEQAMKALRLGYHVLLEKPIAVTEEGCREVVREALRCQRVLSIGLVLRYSPLFATVKEIIAAGTLGDLVAIRYSENMATWVFGHSFVRGNWGNSGRSSSVIIQKGCHDFDILYWLVDSPPELISCTASPPWLSREHMPPGAPPRCTDGCPHAATCLYEAVLLPRRHPHDARHRAFGEYPRQNPLPDRDALSAAGQGPVSAGPILQRHSVAAMAGDPARRGPFRGRHPPRATRGSLRAVRVPVRQRSAGRLRANIRFANGVTATYMLHGMSYRDGRELRIDGTKASLNAVFYNTRFRIQVHDHVTGKTRTIKLPLEYTAGGGGDERIVPAFLDAVAGKSPSRTDAPEALWSHLMCFAAERSINTGTTQRITG